MDRKKRMWLLWKMMVLLLLLLPMLCASVRLGVPSGITTRAQGLKAPSVSESLASSQVVVAAAGNVSSATSGDGEATTEGRIGKSSSSPAGKNKLIGENRRRLLLDAQQNQQSNCTCACTMSCNNQPAPSFSMSCANPIDPAKTTPPTTSTANLGPCGGEANKGAINGLAAAVISNIVLCFAQCESSSCKLACFVFMNGLSTSISVMAGCAQYSATHSACFPGDAAVAMANGGFKPMAALALGDKVAVRKRDGGLAFEDVIAQGHKDAVKTADFIRLTLSPVDANNISGSTDIETRNLELTAFHFVPISTGFPGNALEYKRAKDVLEGDKLLVQRPHPAPRRLGDQSGVPSTSAFPWYVVTNISQVTKQGLYNPFTPSGIIIVNGVVASTHSDWFLDGIFELFNAVLWLPAAYQMVLVPARMLYYGLGKDTYIHHYHWLDSRVDISELLSGRQHGLAASMISFCITVAIAIALGRKIAALLVMRRRLTTKQGPCVSAP